MSRGDYLRLREAWKVEVDRHRKLALDVACWIRSLDGWEKSPQWDKRFESVSQRVGVTLCALPDLMPDVCRALKANGSNVNRRDLKLYEAHGRAAFARARSPGGGGILLSELVAGPTFSDVSEEYKRITKAKVSDWSLRRSLRRLDLHVRSGKRGRKPK